MERRYKNLIITISIVIPVLVGYLIYNPLIETADRSWVERLPHLNACINATTSLLLLAGLYFIKTGRVSYHRTCMLTAFVLGCVFLISYIIYHSTVPSTSFGGMGFIRNIYYVLLITHILLAIVVVPFVLLALYHALKSDFPRHKRMVKIAYPVWLYVSVSGVMVYLMISPYYS